MSNEENKNYSYKVGGSIPVEQLCYVERQADTDLYEGLKAREYCYVLNARQMGKSSLIGRTMQKLKNEGFACTAIDLSQAGKSDATAQNWYAGVISGLNSGFQLKVNLKDWLGQHDYLTPVNRLKHFIEDQLLKKVAEKIIIFIDETDHLLNFQFTDDFLPLLKSCHDGNNNPAFQRITFALFGVATPYELAQDKTNIFNISKSIKLNGIEFDENKVAPLTRGLPEKVENPVAVIQQVLDWTGGQPFLTQKLCQKIVESQITIAVGTEVEQIEDLVQTKLIDNWESQDQPVHLKTIRDRFLNSKKFPSHDLLKIYQKILQQGEIVANDNSREQMELRLSGLVVEKDGKLKVYNKIYEKIFNQDWVDKTLADNNIMPIEQEIYEALKAGEFCYMLSSPLTTKENLLIKIQEYFKNNNIPYAVIDPIQIDSNRKASDFDFQWRGQWYSKVVAIIEKKFGLDYRAKEWWNKTKGEYKEDVPYACLFKKYLQCQLLHHKHDKNLVIIFDKIESIFDDLKFTEEIFTIIRDWYEQRRNNKNYKRLTFLMLGAAIPDGYEYKYHKSITGGWRTNLNNPSPPQVQPIVQKIEGKFRDIDPKVLLSRIWEWTNGHPVLTQKLFQLVLTDNSDIPEGQEAEVKYVDNLVQNIIQDCEV
ncbi:hypothetical protein PL8927_60007 [Planktothrix serta PCC 8927]|uniref:Uncharacterized protein n=1 Tax=Planktothrix serta PCC 8927 TaxID=671068 RepID=A0A7Z9DY28_9CYAN|nr:AAA-like domain-containing protein [Planktothrix serta]VXD17376.1 hypothetical protein PL8927_60007 [Planktothrix serta PCC 8927]